MESTKEANLGRGRRVRLDLPLLLWSLFCVALTPLLLLLKYRRYLRNRFDFEFNPQRWSVRPLTPDRLRELLASGAVHVVFVGGGIGELQMIDRVAKEIASPGVRISYCLRDTSTLRMLQESRPELNIAMWPFDFIVPVWRWLAAQQPDVLVFTERFRFITFSYAAAQAGVKVALMNGRSRPRDSVLHTLAAPIYRWQFSAFRVMAMQRKDYFERVQRFASKDCKVVLTGDIKADLSRVQLAPEQAAEIMSWLDLSGQPLLVAGSTESTEEEAMVLEAYRRVREKVACKLVIAPRKIARREEVLETVHAAGYQASLRTSPSGSADVFVLDTLGELRFVYGLGKAAYVGGAFGSGGGHNVMEPLEWGVPVSYGMTRGYFEALQRACEAAGVGTRIKDGEALANHWLSLLQDPDLQAELARKAHQALEANSGAVQKTVALISELVEEHVRETTQDSQSVQSPLEPTSATRAG